MVQPQLRDTHSRKHLKVREGESNRRGEREQSRDGAVKCNLRPPAEGTRWGPGDMGPSAAETPSRLKTESQQECRGGQLKSCETVEELKPSMVHWGPSRSAEHWAD